MAYKIGEKAEGGIVFYVDDSGDGLVAAEIDQSSRANWDEARKLCSELELNGYRDWYLPSKDELNLMYTNLARNGAGGFAAVRYWSSTEGDNYNAWSQDFDSGDQRASFKGYNTHVRAVRAFINLAI